jgi:hypothetical protein
VAGDNGLQLGWGDKSLRVVGRDILLIILILGLGGLLFWIAASRESEHALIIKAMEGQFERWNTTRERLVEQLEITNYMLSRPEELREALPMPKVLREKYILKKHKPSD